MIDVSAALREARERAGLTLEQLSARTRIKLAFLRAIEAGRFDELPGDFFTRAFLRTYAREIHIDPDEIVHAFDASRQSAEPVSPDPPSPAPHIDRGVVGDEPWILSPSRLAPLLVTALVLTATIYMWARPAVSPTRTAAAPVGTSGVAAAPSSPSAQPATTAAATSSEEPAFLSVEIRATGPTWITATADGQRVAYRLFDTGERTTLRAREELTFRLGNAGAFDYSVNGEPGTPVGGPGDVREFRITRENYRSLTRRP